MVTQIVTICIHIGTIYRHIFMYNYLLYLCCTLRLLLFFICYLLSLQFNIIIMYTYYDLYVTTIQIIYRKRFTNYILL